MFSFPFSTLHFVSLFWTLSFCYFSTIHLFFLSFDFQELRRRRRRRSVSKRNITCADASVTTDKKDHSPSREGWQDSRRSTSPRSTELWLQASPLHPPAPNSKYSTHAFPGTTCPGFHSFWLLPFPKFRSSHSRWAVHCCPRLRGGGLFIRRFCEFGFGFWRDAALYDPWRPSFTSRHCDPPFWHFQLFLFRRFFHFCFIFVFEPSLFLTSGFFFLCTLVLSPPSSFWSFIFIRHEILFVGPFLFHVFFSFFLLCISLFSLLEIISLFLQKNLLVSCLFCLCHFPSVSIAPQKYLVSFAQFFLFPFFLFGLFSWVFLF